MSESRIRRIFELVGFCEREEAAYFGCLFFCVHNH